MLDFEQLPPQPGEFFFDLGAGCDTGRLRRLLAAYRDSEDLIQVGAYARGSDPMVDAAIDRRAALDTFLQQDMRETTSLEQSVGGLLQALGGSPA